jgi:hypothetical protein
MINTDMKILEILLPTNMQDRGILPQHAQKIDTLQKRMDSYVDKICDPKTSAQGKEFLKSRLRDDYYELKNTMHHVHHIAEQKLDELFYQSTDWEWNYKGRKDAEAYFTVGDVKYIFTTYTGDSEGVWEMDFRAEEVKGERPDDRFAVNGTGNSAQVFSVVASIIKDFLNEYDSRIEAIQFSAKEPSRKKLYARMLTRLLPGWSIKTSYDMFRATRPETVTENTEVPEQYEVYDRKTGLKVPGKGPYSTRQRARNVVDKLDNIYGGYRYGQRPVASQPTPISEAVRKLPVSNKDFDVVQELMERPIPAAIAPIYIHEIIDDDELNDTLTELENSNPNMDVRPIIAEWFKRVMPDQLYRFTDESHTTNQLGLMSVIHGYDPHMYQGSNGHVAGNAYGRQ